MSDRVRVRVRVRVKVMVRVRITDLNDIILALGV